LIRRHRNAGFAFVIALLLMTLLLILGIGFLSQRRGQQQAVQSARVRLQAREIARAGIEDAFSKLSKRHDFPPVAGPTGQEVFTYIDEIRDADNRVYGEYHVSVNLDYGSAPYFLARITSLGRVGPADTPSAQVTLHAEIDLSPTVRGSNPPVANPNRYRILSILEEPRSE
jgi:hypothetical protein